MPNLLSKTILKLFGRQACIWMVISMIASLVLAMTDYAIAIYLQIFLRFLGLTRNHAYTLTWIQNWDLQLWHLLVILGTIGIVRSCGQFFVDESISLIEEIIRMRLRLISVYQILRSPSQAFVSASETNTNIGEIFQQVSVFSRFIVTSFSLIIQSVLLLILMVYIAPKEALIGILGLGVIGFFVLIINRKVRRTARKVPEYQKSLITGIERIARNWLLVKVLRTSETEYQKLVGNTLDYFRYFVRSKLLANLGAALPTFFGFLLLIFLLSISVDIFQTPVLKLVSFLFIFTRFLLVFSRVAKFIGMSNSVIPHFQVALTYISNFKDEEIEKATSSVVQEMIQRHKANKLNSLENNIQSISLNSNGSEVKIFPPSIEIKNVSFIYPSRKEPIFQDIYISIKPGEQLGIIGESGSGKSTLLGLILGVIKPTEGSIYISGMETDEFFNQPTTRIGYVGSEPFLIEGTIKENLDYGARQEYSTEEYYQALEAASILETINKLPEGLDYLISENKEGLSTGQKQRLCLARALLSKPQLLILDEASANLDENTEMEIANSVEKLKGKCTMIIASHKPGILKFVDKTIDLTTKS
jgi:ABC-type multidrug transport system fused ATPase/permease subunit